MSNYRAERILKPAYFRLAPLQQGRARQPLRIVGFDSEADNGYPFLYQFNDGGTANDTKLVDVPRKKYASLSYFLRHIEEHYCSREFDTIIFGYNLVYEFTQLFRDLRDKDLPAFNVYLVSPLTGKSWWINVWNDKRYMATFYRLTRPPTQKELDTNGRYHPRSTVRITLLDASAFYHGGLDAVGEMLGLGAKEHKPQEFSRKSRNLPSFVKYAKQDAYLTRLIGEKIVADHERYDIRQCISAPMYAAKVFRRKFLNDEIPLAKPDIEQAGLYSYHGGKNGYYRNGPKHLPNVYAYDITSAYPEAMRALPNPVVSEFAHTSVYVPHVHALYYISGTYRRCKYRAFLSHAQGWQVDGVIDGLWITSYELDAALEHDEIALTDCHGYIMDGPPGGPLADYVDEFFDLKSKSVGAMRELAKLLLNSLYGKFFQKVPLGSMKDEIEIVQTGDKPIRFDQHETWAFERRQTDPEQEYDYQAGGLYHPAIASLITGFVRAKIHRLEHKYDAIMTSTDGFFATRKPDPSDIGTSLGKLTVGFGDLSVWRERLYLFEPKDNGKLKAAYHGFRGGYKDLRAIPLEPGTYEYFARQVITNKLAGRDFKTAGGIRSFEPGVFATLTFSLRLDPGP